MKMISKICFNCLNDMSEESVLKFLFEESWSDDMKEWWMASLSELLDICPPETKNIDKDRLTELFRTSILKGLKKE